MWSQHGVWMEYPERSQDPHAKDQGCTTEAGHAAQAMRAAARFLFDEAHLIETSRVELVSPSRLASRKEIEGKRAELRASAAQHLSQRADRKQFGFSPFVGEPGWDILLDLFVGWASDRQMRTKDVCIASGGPNTTALRYLTALEAANLVRRWQDPRDSRVVNVALTEDGVRKIGSYLLWLRRDRQEIGNSRI